MWQATIIAFHQLFIFNYVSIVYVTIGSAIKSNTIKVAYCLSSL